MWDVGERRRRSESPSFGPGTTGVSHPKMKPRSKTPTPRSSGEGLRATSPLRQGKIEDDRMRYDGFLGLLVAPACSIYIYDSPIVLVDGRWHCAQHAMMPRIRST